MLEAASATVPGVVATAAADVTDRVALGAALDHLEAALGAPTVLVNNAGHGYWGCRCRHRHRRLPAGDRGELPRCGQRHRPRPAAACVTRGRGSIVNVASIAGRIGAPFEAAYSASKFALVGYTEALGIELAGTGVTVSLIQPGPVDTDFFRTRGHRYELRRPRPIPADRVADAVVKAVHQGRHEVFVPAWLGLAYAAKVAAPPFYRRTTQRLFARQRGDLRQRLRP